MRLFERVKLLKQEDVVSGQLSNIESPMTKLFTVLFFTVDQTLTPLQKENAQFW